MRIARSSSRFLGGDLPQCMLGYTPWPGPGHPPGCGPGDPQDVGPEPSPSVWAWRPPHPDPSTSSLGVGLENPPSSARPLNLPPGYGPGDPLL